MMNVTYRTDKSILYIAIEGRVDASSAPVLDEKIAEIKMEHAGKNTVIDADRLEYISSAGLRVILKLRKDEPKLALINVSAEVYDVFDMTGFTDMITVERAYRRMSVEGCEFLAKGANGAVYRYDDETIVKTYYSKDALPEIKQERENARRAFVLGINTAIPYGIVRVGDGYGTVTELLSAVNVTKLICRDKENIDLASEYYVNLLKDIHSTEAEDGDFPDMKKKALDWALFLKEHLPSDMGEKLISLISALPKRNTLIHGDYHTNNVMIQNDEPLLIDLDTLALGHPIFELGSMYNAFIGFSELDHSNVERFMGYDFETSVRFWHTSLGKYLGATDEKRIKEVEDKARLIGYTRLLRRILRRRSEDGAEEKIRHYRESLLRLLDRIDTLEF